jgi:hypothetical protein
MDPSPDPVSIPLLLAKLDILALSWATSGTSTHLSFAFT